MNIENFKIYSREEVPVKWGIFADPWGNLLGFFEYLDKTEEKERMKTLSDNQPPSFSNERTLKEKEPNF